MTAAARSAARAHAKVNLRHRVFPRDRTGYHAVETILARTTLCDVVELEQADAGIAVEVGGEPVDDVPTDDRNLCVRAARAFLERAFPGGEAPGVRIRLTKRIPAGTGLGGGSADAGATLGLLAARWPVVDERGLLEIAGGLGSDVAFATLGVPLALGWERGRRLLPLRPPPPAPALLVCAPFRVSTPDAYGWLDADRTDERPADPGGAVALPGPTRWTEWPVLGRMVRNDLQAPVFRRHPELAGCLETLAATATGATMTGSGSALAAWFASERDRDAARAAVSSTVAGTESGWRLFDVELPV